MTSPYVNYLISEIRQVKSWKLVEDESRTQMSHILKVLECGITSVGHEEIGSLIHGLFTTQQRIEMSGLMMGMFLGFRSIGIYLIAPPRFSKELTDTIYLNRHKESITLSTVRTQSLEIPQLVQKILTVEIEGLPKTLPAAWLLHHVFPHIPIDEHYIQRLNKTIRALKYTNHPLHGWYQALLDGTSPSHEVVAFLKTLESLVNVPKRVKETST